MRTKKNFIEKKFYLMVIICVLEKGTMRTKKTHTKKAQERDA